MNTDTIGAVSLAAALFAFTISFIVPRLWPARNDLAQTRLLIDQLITEQASGRALRTEIEALRVEVAHLREENAALKRQVADLWAMMRGQDVARSSVEAATRPAQPKPPTRPASVQMTDDDVLFRDWLAEHFDAPDLLILCADAGLDRPPAGKITEMATAIVQQARRTGCSEHLRDTASAARPNVESW